MSVHEVPRETGVATDNFAFTMPYRKIKAFNASSEDARRITVHNKIHPPILEPALVIAHQGQISASVVSFRGGKHPQLGKKLESIAYSEQQAAGIHKLDQAIDKPLSIDPRMFDSIRACLSGSKIVTVQEAARKDDYPVIRRICFTCGQKIQVNQINPIKTRQLQGAPRLKLAVDAMTGGHKGI
jgi:hypothetical protein